MKTILLTCCSLFIAVGVGLEAFSQRYERNLPSFTLDDVQAVLTTFNQNYQSGYNRPPEVDMPVGVTARDRMIVSVTQSVGLGLITLGILGWIPTLFNVLKSVGSGLRIVQMNEHTARTLSIVAIWFAVAIVLGCSLLGSNFTLSFATTANALAFTLFLGGLSTVSTAILCGWRPRKSTFSDAPTSSSNDLPPATIGAAEMA